MAESLRCDLLAKKKRMVTQTQYTATSMTASMHALSFLAGGSRSATALVRDDHEVMTEESGNSLTPCNSARRAIAGPTASSTTNGHDAFFTEKLSNSQL